MNPAPGKLCQVAKFSRTQFESPGRDAAIHHFAVGLHPGSSRSLGGGHGGRSRMAAAKRCRCLRYERLIHIFASTIVKKRSLG